MKKEYVSPCAKTIKIQSKGLLSGSNPTGFQGTLDNTKTINSNQMLGRGGFYFEDEEE